MSLLLIAGTERNPGPRSESSVGSTSISSETQHIIEDKFSIVHGPRQANLVLIAYASSEGSGEPAPLRSLARTFAARS